MNHDFSHRSKQHKKNSANKKRARGKHKKKSFSIPSWIWLVVGLTLGISFTYLFSTNSPTTATDSSVNTLTEEELKLDPEQAQIVQTTETVHSGSTHTTTVNSDQSSTPTTAKVQKFEFYTILSEQEVMTEELQKPESLTRIQHQKPHTINRNIDNSKSKYYVFQAGSFQNSNDAQALSDKISAASLPVSVEHGIVSQGNIETSWHRVIVGPFNSPEQINRAEQQLNNLQIKPLLMKRSKP